MSSIEVPVAAPSSPRVLIVEDDPIFGHALEMRLLLDGLSVAWSRDGCGVVESFEPGQYDALLVDLGLPGMSGFEVVREVRRRDPHVAILIVTGEASIAERIHGLQLGADDYLVKPFELRELLARLRAIGRRRPIALASGAPNENSGAPTVDSARRPELTLNDAEAAIVGLMLASPESLPAQALVTLLRARGHELSLREIQVSLASLQVKFAGRLWADHPPVTWH